MTPNSRFADLLEEFQGTVYEAKPKAKVLKKHRLERSVDTDNSGSGTTPKVKSNKGRVNFTNNGHGNPNLGRNKKKHSVKLICGDMNQRESAMEVIACNDYLRMGASRSIAGLHRMYLETQPSYDYSIKTLYHWCWDFQWSVRADEWDNKTEKEKQKVADEAMQTGLAQPHARLRELKHLAQVLRDEIARPEGLHIIEEKQVGNGPTAKIIRVKKFNSALIEQYRQTLDDIAKETGGRIKPGNTGDTPLHIDITMKGKSISNNGNHTGDADVDAIIDADQLAESEKGEWVLEGAEDGESEE